MPPNISHNDLKLDNIMLSYPGTLDPKVKIIDFGHANFNNKLRRKGSYKARKPDAPELLLLNMEISTGCSTDKV